MSGITRRGDEGALPYDSVADMLLARRAYKMVAATMALMAAMTAASGSLQGSKCPRDMRQ